MKLSRIIAFVLLLMTTMACQDDWSFSVDDRYELEFSADTLELDTVFTGVSSGSYLFMVYNPNGVNLRFDAVMGGGASSSFRINLDGQGGAQILGQEIAAHDSLFCYVSVNIPESDDLGYFREFDSVRFVLESGNVQYVRLRACGENAVRLKGRRIMSDTTLTAHKPFLIYDSLYVAEGATLTLAPGTRLYFHNDAVLDIAGRIVAQGSQDSMIVMRGDRLDVMQTVPPVPYDLRSSQWRGIRIRGGSYDNVFRYCDIHSSDFGIKADSAAADRIKLGLYSSIINNVKGNCIEATGCRIEVANSQITNAGVSCVDVAGGVSDFMFCTIASFSLWSLGEQAVMVTDRRDGVPVPFVGARFRNCIITGRHADEFVASLADSVKKLDVYSVSNSLVRTTDSLDTHLSNVVFDAGETVGADNFRCKSRDGLRPVFRLDSLSKARGAAGEGAALWPVDLAGVARPPMGADAGCYQYVDY